MPQSCSVRLRVIAAALIVLIPAWAHAQAFTPPKGEGAVTLSFQDTLVKRHYFGTTAVDRGEIRLQALVLDLGYGITDKLAVGIALPWIRAQYKGAAPHPALPGGTFLDDGRYHGSIQDLRFDVRYNLTRAPLVITPYAAAIVPTHEYVFLAHSAVGRQLREFQAGVFVARLLDPMVPRAFVQARYGLGIPERTIGIRPVRSNLDVEVGYFINDSLRAFALGMGQVTHGGIDIPPAGGSTIANPFFVHHDQIGRENAVKMGAGAALTINDRIDVFASALKTVAARNGHAFAYTISAGATYSFGKRGGSAKAAPSAADAAATAVCHDDADAREGALGRCVCIKG